MSPEMLLAEDYGTPADVFALGLVMASLAALGERGGSATSPSKTRKPAHTERAP